MIDRYLHDVQTDLVASDHFGGGYAVVQHLIEQGYTDIIYLARHPLHLSSIEERFRGYQSAMADAGLTQRPPFVVGGPTELGYDQSRRTFTLPESPVVSIIAELLRSTERPQAIVAMNDMYALLVLEAAQKAGVDVPNDLAVVGFDDLDLAASATPPLTTVAQEPFRLGVEAARLLLAHIRGERKSIGQIRLPTQIVIRESSLSHTQSHR